MINMLTNTSWNKIKQSFRFKRFSNKKSLIFPKLTGKKSNLLNFKKYLSFKIINLYVYIKEK